MQKQQNSNNKRFPKQDKLRANKMLVSLLATSMLFGSLPFFQPIKSEAITQTYANLISPGFTHSMVVQPNGTVYGWGDGQYGRTSGSGITNVVAVESGAWNTHVLKTDGTVWGWGFNAVGQIGDGTTGAKNKPTQVKDLTNVESISYGHGYGLALKSDGTVWAWGANSDGTVGNNSTRDQPYPVPVSGLTDVVAIDAGKGHALATKSDGSLWIWGSTSAGQKLVPFQLTAMNSVKEAKAGQGHDIVVKRDGTVWTWGSNGSGQLGNGTNRPPANYMMPAMVPGLSNVTSVAAGSDHSLALKSDGTVWAWGSNAAGQIGIGTNVNALSPVQVKGLSNIIAIDAKDDFNLAIKSDGTVWGWGENTSGQVGTGNTAPVTTPVQLSGINLSLVKNKDEVPPTITLTPSVTSPTQSSFTMNVNVTDVDSGIEVVKWANGNQPVSYFASQGSAFTGNSFVVMQNGTYTFYAKDKSGNEAVKSITISNIDTKLPTVSVTKTPSGITNGTVQISLQAVDSETGVKRIKLPNNSYINGSTASFTVSENGSYLFEIEDNAGNILKETVVVDNIVKGELSKATFVADKTTLTNGNVRVTIDYPTDASVKEYKIGSTGNWVGYSSPILMVNNGVVFARYKTTDGRVSPESNYAVTNIDKDSPISPKIVTNVSGPTNQDVQVNIEYPSDAARKLYKIGGNGAWTDYTNPITLTSNNTVYAKAYDEAGNESGESTLAILYIDKIAPTPPTSKFVRGNLNLTDGIDSESGVKETLVKTETIRPKMMLRAARSDSFLMTEEGWEVYNPNKKIPDGKYRFSFKTVDKAGNVSPVVTMEGIIYANALSQSENAVNNAEKQKTQEKLKEAKDIVNQLPDVPEKKELLDRLDELQKEIDKIGVDNLLKEAIKKVEQAEQYKRDPYISDAQKAIDKLADGKDKTDLQERLNKIKKEISDKDQQDKLKEATRKVEQAEQYKRDPYISDAQKLIDQLTNSPEKQALQDRLDKIKKDISDKDQKDLLKEATRKVEQAEQYKRDPYITDAQKLIDKLTASPEKQALQDRLDKVKNKDSDEDQKDLLKEATRKVEQAEQYKRDPYIADAQKLIDKLTASPEKQALQDRLDKVKNKDSDENQKDLLKEATRKVEQAEQYKRDPYMTDAQKLIDKLAASPEKQALQDRLDKVKNKDSDDNQKDLLKEATRKVEQAEQYKRDPYITDAQKLIDKLATSPEKQALQDRLDKAKLGNDDGEQKDLLKNATRKVEQAEQYKRDPYIADAQKLIDQLKDGQDKQALQERLDKVKSEAQNKDQQEKLAEATKRVEQAEQYKRDPYVSNAQKLIDTLPEGKEKAQLQSRLDIIKNEIANKEYKAKLLEATKKVEQAEQHKRDPYITDAQRMVSNLPDGSDKDALQSRLNAIEKGSGEAKPLPMSDLDQKIENIKEPIEKELFKDVISSVYRAERYFSKQNIEYAIEKINSVPSETRTNNQYQSIFDELQQKVDKLKADYNNSISDQAEAKAISKATTYVELYEKHKSLSYKNKAKECVDALKSESVKDGLQARIDAVIK
ncbi:hypothetical protein ACFVS2_26085 [Brevibacillus sp. NPDC058079]|uniref:RCC1 domain-containing protein n=1 Tax=Brevibacillus sp. NPDC058079 TaxID=3346330 RepID=UPI0036EFF664